MSLELVDKGVSTEDLDSENVEEKEVQKENSKEKEEKETTDLEKLEAVLSALVDNKVKSIRNCSKKVKEKKLSLSKFRKKDGKGKEETEESKSRVNSTPSLVPSCKCACHQSSRGSIVPCEVAQIHRYKIFSKCPRASIESSHRLNLLCPRHSFESCDASVFCKASEGICCCHRTDAEQILDGKKLPIQKCLPKRLSTEQWLNSTSRQASTETATTSSGYISPTFGTGKTRNRSALCESDAHQPDVLTETSNDVDCETIIDMSKIQAQKTLDEIDESKEVEKASKLKIISAGESEHFNFDDSRLKDAREKCGDSCHVFLPQCLSSTCIPSCRYSLAEDQRCYNAAPSYKHLHPSGGHYVSCCNSPTHSFQRFQYDENYLTLAMNLEDLEFEQEEERRKRRKRKKKRRKERQARARGLMAVELQSVKKAAKQIDPEDLPKRARWTIVATACLLLLMSMLLVGVTLRMAPIIDEMVRKENEEMFNSLNRQGIANREATSSNATKSNSTLENFMSRP